MSSTDPLLVLATDLGGAPAELKETHISRVALSGEPGAGGVVLKQCKPVDFGFVDLRTREQRRAALEKEHAVNDRFAPGVYRGVRELSDGEPVLEMLRLNEADTLEAKVKRGEATAADLDPVLDHLLPLFEASERTPQWGDPAVIRQNLTENLDVLDEAERRFGVDLWAIALRSEQLTCLTLIEPELDARAADGWIRDGHGDLRCEHVYLTTDGVKVLDGIAFSDRLRCVDVADEVCFLAVDLKRLLEEQYADSSWGGLHYELLDRYGDRSGDPNAEPHCSVLLAFYESYRAAVRAKIAAIRALSTDSEGERADALREAKRWIEPTLTWLTIMREMHVTVLVGGLSGSGKSTLAAALAERLGATQLRSDVIRKQLFPAGDDGSSDYSPEATAETYDVLLNLLWHTFPNGVHAVVDATFRKGNQREQFLRIARTEDPDEYATLFVWCEVDDAVAERRIAGRAAEGADASDATVDVRRTQAAKAEPPTEAEFAALPHSALLRLDTDAPIETLVERVIEALRDLVESDARVAGSGGVQ
ncbi:AAA family ATPase [Alienimonas chondri]|uniref:Adenylyl-sulfate kinase n=1 Tax=Alienimonas chondri TaxID=2681879 RepID=A0ABX1V8U4_9PLAN|nr:bifunctional aminoglycoside phosphotransferase/ATP-binding protein [Alienimonas chondri]NNJ24435.1 hypothetical protein [Alienimonas chondri]